MLQSVNGHKRSSPDRGDRISVNLIRNHNGLITSRISADLQCPVFKLIKPIDLVFPEIRGVIVIIREKTVIDPETYHFLAEPIPRQEQFIILEIIRDRFPFAVAGPVIEDRFPVCLPETVIRFRIITVRVKNRQIAAIGRKPEEGEILTPDRDPGSDQRRVAHGWHCLCGDPAFPVDLLPQIPFRR